MNKKNSKIFSIFWFIAGVIWLLATFRHLLIKGDDIIGLIIYIIAAIISFILAFAYYKNFIK